MLLRETLEKLESNFLGSFLVGGAVGAGWPYPLLVGDLFNFFTTYSEGFKSISAGAECQYPTSQLATTHVWLITNFTHPWHYGILEQLLFGI